jgi:cysteine desulfurase
MQKKTIYADNAATTQLNKAAFEAMVPWLTEDYGNASQPYALSRSPKKALADARATIARCINALPEEIYFTSGGTESDNWAIKGSAFEDPERRATITSAIEHHAVLHSCEAIEKLGFPVAYISVTSDGMVTPETLENTITDKTRLVSVVYVNNEIGTIQPLRELVEIAHSHGALFHADAVQAVGHIPVDVQALGVDMLSASAHKFNGPKGVGFLYIRKGVHIGRFADGGSQENGLRAGTENIAGIVGMAVALEEVCTIIDSELRRLAELRKLLIRRLNEAGIDFIVNGGDAGYPGTISLSFKNADGEKILHRLDLQGIYVSTGSACDSVNTQISHVIRALNVSDEYAKGTIRVSLGRYNTADDVESIAVALTKILRVKHI